jgi:bidirectional [NiFe] hydrogenase diaphorase subunit
MPTELARAAPPTDDRRWRVVETSMRRQGFAPNALIEILHSVQETFGFLDLPSLRYVASNLSVPLSRVYGVATFYHYFTLAPPGQHSCVVCTGTACYIKGSSGILKTLERDYEVGPGQTTSDGRLSVLTARCLGSCGLAPAAVFDGEVVGRLTPERVLETVQRLTHHDA